MVTAEWAAFQVKRFLEDTHLAFMLICQHFRIGSYGGVGCGCAGVFSYAFTWVLGIKSATAPIYVGSSGTFLLLCLVSSIIKLLFHIAVVIVSMQNYQMKGFHMHYHSTKQGVLIQVVDQ